MAELPAAARLLRGRRVVLASGSPRRREILGRAGLGFEVVPSRFPEASLDPGAFPGRPAAFAEETAARKALEVAARLRGDVPPPDLVIGADTVVAVDDVILGKPADEDDARRMLSRLSGRTHSVFTGVALVWRSDSEEATRFHEETRVTFSALPEELVAQYVESGEPMDKAGGYGLQAQGAALVESVQGDVLSAVGFPLRRFCRVLAARALSPPPPPPPTSAATSNPGPGAATATTTSASALLHGVKASESPCDPEEDSQDALRWLTAAGLASAFDLTRFRRACALGGGAIAVAAELQLRFPRLGVTALEAPPPGRPLPGADLYVLPGFPPRPPRRPDGGPGAWARLLDGAADACGPGAAVLVTQRALDLLDEEEEEEDGGHGDGDPSPALRRLLQRRGFRDIQVVAAPSAGGATHAALGVRGGGER
ncbi:probable bifunctional dTTP/UTP pyrophosphatase/methyltransferase protein [Perognathus longimembris pacificus]|uniref:probable bifunctional dTTP/UTP pyrophosphatase/methyltransferase protein n=1 Tax=Perognathus longimembris pacificus TaxID=214514 RepID=UPI002018552D|nr:probable bifunctional dTTP/UTP pyrophosphatase/methyltransferase protein [Perognathus longimembris pacificus]